MSYLHVISHHMPHAAYAAAACFRASDGAVYCLYISMFLPLMLMSDDYAVAPHAMLRPMLIRLALPKANTTT